VKGPKQETSAASAGKPLILLEQPVLRDNASHVRPLPRPRHSPLELPPRLCRMLYRAVDQQPAARPAPGETGGRALPAPGCRLALPAFWPARTPSRLRWPATVVRDVRPHPKPRHALPASAGAGHLSRGLTLLPCCSQLWLVNHSPKHQATARKQLTPPQTAAQKPRQSRRYQRV
jgi:hypothetical protein